MKNVLILEDDANMQVQFGEFFGKEVRLLQALTLKDAENLYEENKDSLDIIVLDGQVPFHGSSFKDTVELAAHIKESFEGTMISISQDDRIIEKFKGLGMEILKYKFDLPTRMFELIRNPKTI